MSLDDIHADGPERTGPAPAGPNLGDPRVDELAEAVRSEAAAVGRAVDLSGAEVRSGWESVVLWTADGWIYRFPRPHVDFWRELAILRRLRGRLPVPVPDPEWTGARTPFMAYRRLEGATFDRAAYDRASTAEREALAASLASFLAAMHSAFTPAEVRALDIPNADDRGADDEGLDEIGARLADVGGFAERAVRELLDEIREHRARSTGGRRVVLHDDFNVSNLALTGRAGVLAAVWDFSCVRVGDPATDLRYLVEESSDLFGRVLTAYQRITGRELDPRTAVLAHRLELVSDAIVLGDLGGLERRSRRWPTGGVG